MCLGHNEGRYRKTGNGLHYWRMSPDHDHNLEALLKLYMQAARDIANSGGHCFPRGACDWTSEILGPILFELGYGEWEYVSANRYTPDRASHAWLERGDLVVDVTAAQFREEMDLSEKDMEAIGVAPTKLTRHFQDNQQRRSSLDGPRRQYRSRDRDIRTWLVAIGVSGIHSGFRSR